MTGVLRAIYNAFFCRGNSIKDTESAYKNIIVVAGESTYQTTLDNYGIYQDPTFSWDYNRKDE